MPDTESPFEKETIPMNVTELGPLNYGTPGKISYTYFENRINKGELPPTILDKTAEIIESKACMVKVHGHSDGCIDGRCTKTAHYFDEDGNEVEAPNEDRYKVAGGGYVTGASMLLGTEAPQVNANAQIAYTTELLNRHGVVCGVHTADHAAPGGTGCGANDSFETILGNGLEHAQSIAGNVQAIMKALGYEYSSTTFEAVLKGWETTLQTTGFFEGTDGKSRYEEIKKGMQRAQKASSNDQPVATSKELTGEHREAFIVANLVKGVTFSQPILAAKLNEAFPEVAQDELPQAFVIDFQRIVELAEALASETDGDFESLLQAGIAYQFATAATLTDGSLPAFLVA